MPGTFRKGSFQLSSHSAHSHLPSCLCPHHCCWICIWIFQQMVLLIGLINSVFLPIISSQVSCICMVSLFSVERNGGWAHRPPFNELEHLKCQHLSVNSLARLALFWPLFLLISLTFPHYLSHSDESVRSHVSWAYSFTLQHSMPNLQS